MIERDLVATAERIGSREDFIAFVHALRADLSEHPDDWENRDLESFLEAMASWVADMDGYYKFFGKEPPEELNWKIVSDVLMGARVYE